LEIHHFALLAFTLVRQKELLLKTIGLIGGMSWESSIEYYRILNELVRQRLGGVHSAQCVMVSVDFAPFDKFMQQGQWQPIGQLLIQAALQVEQAGADFVLLCTNTMHKMAPQIQAAINIPLLHIAEAAGQRIVENGLQTVGLLGTRFTMQEDFYKNYLTKHFKLSIIVPPDDERATIDRVIFEELVCGKILPESKIEYQNIITGLVSQGAQGIILGCTEIGLLINPEDSPVPVFETTRIHAEAAVMEAFKLES
jgi:aspartate racemase